MAKDKDTRVTADFVRKARVSIMTYHFNRLSPDRADVLLQLLDRVMNMTAAEAISVNQHLTEWQNEP